MNKKFTKVVAILFTTSLVLSNSTFAANLTGTKWSDSLTGTSGADYIRGLEGDDYLFGAQGDDIIEGAEGNDTIDGGQGNDTLRGGYGADTIRGGAGVDIIYGGSGYDILEGGDDLGENVNGYAGYDQIFAMEGQDKIITRGYDMLDLTENLAQKDTVILTNGTKVVKIKGFGAEDVFQYDGDVTAAKFTITDNGGEKIVVYNGDNWSASTGVESVARTTLTGGFTNGNDIFTGTSLPEILSGKSGSDMIWGMGGDDIIDGGNGFDFLYGGEGNDALTGGAGNDVLYGEEGNDVLFGGIDNDIINGGNGDDTLLGGQGNDILTGGAGNDMIYGGMGNNVFFPGEGNDLIFSKGVDTVYLNTSDTGFKTIIVSGRAGNRLTLVVDKSISPSQFRVISADDEFPIASSYSLTATESGSNIVYVYKKI